jgi:hypothetical protein
LHSFLVAHGNKVVAHGNVTDRLAVRESVGDDFPMVFIVKLIGLVFPNDHFALLRTSDQQTPGGFVAAANDLVVENLLVVESHGVVLVLVEIPATNHVFRGNRAEQAVADPEGS